MDRRVNGDEEKNKMFIFHYEQHKYIDLVNLFLFYTTTRFDFQFQPSSGSILVHKKS